MAPRFPPTQAAFVDCRMREWQEQRPWPAESFLSIGVTLRVSPHARQLRRDCSRRIFHFWYSVVETVLS